MLFDLNKNVDFKHFTVMNNITFRNHIFWYYRIINRNLEIKPLFGCKRCMKVNINKCFISVSQVIIQKHYENALKLCHNDGIAHQVY